MIYLFIFKVCIDECNIYIDTNVFLIYLCACVSRLHNSIRNKRVWDKAEHLIMACFTRVSALFGFSG